VVLAVFTEVNWQLKNWQQHNKQAAIGSKNYFVKRRQP
jgi:hypothetical protein